jgi:RHS repeat-associated protein
VFDAAGALVYVDEVVGGTAEVQVCFADCGKVAIVAPQKTDYINAGNLSVRLENDQPTYLHNDLLGSPVAATDAFGVVIWQEHYTPYGEKWQRAAANDDQASFTGHIADSATGLTYMEARYYDPVIGRFLSNDPVGFAPSRPEYFNRYAYVGNDPLNKTDPDGQMANFVVKFAVDVALEITIQAATGQDIDIGSAVKESAKGILNPAKTAEKLAKLGGIASKGVVYMRTNPKTGEKYVGQAKSKERFDARQKEHDKKIGVKHEYEVLGKAESGKKLDALEEAKIRENGGIQKEGGELANKRHQMSEKNYSRHCKSHGC